MNSSEATTYITSFACKQMEDAEDYLRKYILAWLDTAMNDDNSTLDVCLGLLRTMQHVQKFNNGENCFKYLSSIAENRAFLILSCTIDDQLLNDFIALPQVEYIYHFGHETILKKEHSKLVEIATSEALYDHLSKYSRYSTEEDNDTEFASLESKVAVQSIQDLNEDARIFIFYQLLIEILLHLPKTPAIKEQFLSFCMEKTNDNPAQQKIFLEWMEKYTPDQAISWYTGTCSFHKLLNRTCRLGKIKDMFKLAFFMVDLNAQLKNLHHEYFYSFPEKLDVYRGRRMLTTEYTKLQNSIGELVVTKSFLSTTTDKDVACMYSGAGTQKPDFVPAILHMIIDKQRNETKSFARVLYNSQIRGDNEVLISIGTVFRIIKENQENDIHEFTLFRGDEEKNVECKIQNAFHDQTKESNTFFHLDSSTDVDGYYKQMADILTSSDNQVKESFEETTPSTITEKISPGNELSFKIPVEWQFLEADGRFKRVSKEMKGLKEVEDIFILDCGPTYGTSLGSYASSTAASKSCKYIIVEGRILPKSEPYCQRSFSIRFTIGPGYPYEPPTLRFLDSIYHPNVNNDGRICIPLLNVFDSYNPAVSLATIIINAEELISSFDEKLVINNEAYRQYKDDPDEFNRKALDFTLRYGSPRP